MSILFCNIGWMIHYDGITEDDKIVGGFSYIEMHEFGCEVYNFSPTGDNYEGYVMTQGDIHIERLGAAPDDAYIDDVLVVWVSKKPDDGLKIIGWYKNARVFRQYQESISGGKREEDGCPFNIQARIEDCTLLPVEERDFVIPRTTSKESPGIGRSQTWYAEGEKNSDLISEVEKYIEDYEKGPLLSSADILLRFLEPEEYRFPYVYLISTLFGIEKDRIFLNETCHEAVADAFALLTNEQALILCLYFGIHDGRPRTIYEIAKKLNSRCTIVDEIKNKALRRLRHPSCTKKLQECFHQNQ